MIELRDYIKAVLSNFDSGDEVKIDVGISMQDLYVNNSPVASIVVDKDSHNRIQFSAVKK